MNEAGYSLTLLEATVQPCRKGGNEDLVSGVQNVHI